MKGSELRLEGLDACLSGLGLGLGCLNLERDPNISNTTQVKYWLHHKLEIMHQRHME